MVDQWPLGGPRRRRMLARTTVATGENLMPWSVCAAIGAAILADPNSLYRSEDDQNGSDTVARKRKSESTCDTSAAFALAALVESTPYLSSDVTSSPTISTDFSGSGGDFGGGGASGSW